MGLTVPLILFLRNTLESFLGSFLLCSYFLDEWNSWRFVALFILNDSQPPIVPKLSGDGDISNFETYPESELDKTPSVSDKDLETFKNFWGWELMSER